MLLGIKEPHVTPVRATYEGCKKKQLRHNVKKTIIQNTIIAIDKKVLDFTIPMHRIIAVVVFI